MGPLFRPRADGLSPESGASHPRSRAPRTPPRGRLEPGVGRHLDLLEGVQGALAPGERDLLEGVHRDLSEGGRDLSEGLQRGHLLEGSFTHVSGLGHNPRPLRTSKGTLS